jgi:hypothetical protein
MKTTILNQDLRQAFVTLTEAAGMPIERLPGHAANQLYRFAAGPHANKTLRLRTNRDYAVMSLARGTEASEAIPSLADVDFVGVACVSKRGDVECYLIPAARLKTDMQAGHCASSAGLNRPSGSKVRVLYFASDKGDRAWYGYARKYAEFLIRPAGKVADLKAANSGVDVIDRARRMIASEFGVSASAVRISIDDLMPDKPLLNKRRPGERRISYLQAR